MISDKDTRQENVRTSVSIFATPFKETRLEYTMIQILTLDHSQGRY